MSKISVSKTTAIFMIAVLVVSTCDKFIFDVVSVVSGRVQRRAAGWAGFGSLPGCAGTVLWLLVRSGSRVSIMINTSQL